MKKRFKSMLKNSNPSLNTIDENFKAKPASNINVSATASRNIPMKPPIVKSISDQGFSRPEPSSQHEDIRRKYKSTTDAPAACSLEIGSPEKTDGEDFSGFTEEAMDVFDSQLDSKQSPTSGVLRPSSVPFASGFPWLSRNNRASIARREANVIIDHVRKVSCTCADFYAFAVNFQ